jgi:endonuclease G
MKRYAKLLLIVLMSCTIAQAQGLEADLSAAEQKKSGLEEQRAEVIAQIEDIRLAMIRRDLKAVGLPGNNIIEHSAMILEYSEPHEQALWVAHIISPQIITGTQHRSNDFRIDPKVATGTALWFAPLLIVLSYSLV